MIKMFLGEIIKYSNCINKPYIVHHTRGWSEDNAKTKKNIIIPEIGKLSISSSSWSPPFTPTTITTTLTTTSTTNTTTTITTAALLLLQQPQQEQEQRILLLLRLHTSLVLFGTLLQSLFIFGDLSPVLSIIFLQTGIPKSDVKSVIVWNLSQKDEKRSLVHRVGIGEVEDKVAGEQNAAYRYQIWNRTDSITASFRWLWQ